MSTPSSFRVIVADPPWEFGDKLDKMKAGTARSAASNYPTLDMAALKALPIDLLADEDAVLALWTPCSLFEDGLDLMRAWGFQHRQEWVWVKLTQSEGEEVLVKPDGTVNISTTAIFRPLAGAGRTTDRVKQADPFSVEFQLPLAFGMGRLARAAKESCLIGVRGSPYKHLANKSQRDVFFAPAGRHSKKPEALQDMLDVMFPEGNRLELFARRQRSICDTLRCQNHPPDVIPTIWRWSCIGNEAPATMGEDIRDSVKRLLGEVRVRCRLAEHKNLGRRGLVVLKDGELTHGPTFVTSDATFYVLDPKGDHEFPASVELRRALAGGR